MQWYNMYCTLMSQWQTNTQHATCNQKTHKTLPPWSPPKLASNDKHLLILIPKQSDTGCFILKRSWPFTRPIHEGGGLGTQEMLKICSWAMVGGAWTMGSVVVGAAAQHQGAKAGWPASSNVIIKWPWPITHPINEGGGVRDLRQAGDLWLGNGWGGMIDGQRHHWCSHLTLRRI